MPTSLITPALAADWIQRLARPLAKIRGDRRAEITRISDEFHDVEMLAKSYIDPDCQFFNPADFDEDEPGRVLRSPVRQWINEFLSGAYSNHDGRHVVFILSDAGMGKTSLLMMLKLTHLMRFWPQELDFQLLKLGPDTLDRVRAFEGRRRIVLLLDSLDEDPEAWGRIEERLHEILHETRNFRQVFVTCRTQFFPKNQSETARTPIEQPGKIEVEGYVCNLLYLSPFSNQQVNAYLRKLYASWFSEIWRWATGKESRKVDQAEKVVIPMKSLRMRPMLLAYVQDLMDSELDSWGEYAVYEAMVLRWLRREKRKQKSTSGPSVDDLLKVCQRLALELYQQQARTIPQQDLEALLKGLDVDLTKLDVGGRSLLNRTSSGEFRFAHYSIQEFLVAQVLSTAAHPKARLNQTTDQIGSFLLSFFGDEKRPFEERLNAGKALGQNGDPRLAPGVDNFLEVPGLDLRSAKGDVLRLYLGKYPVTVEEYRRFVEAGGYREQRHWSSQGLRLRNHQKWKAPYDWDRQLEHPNYPVVGVSWYEACAFCNWLAKNTGAMIRLPSEEHWEGAAMADGRRYPWGREKPTPALANFDDNLGTPSPVGLYPAGDGAFGHSELAGNVWEWGADPYADTETGDNNAVRVVRGGSWNGPAGFLRAAIRRGNGAGVRYPYIGFRVCRFGPEP